MKTTKSIALLIAVLMIVSALYRVVFRTYGSDKCIVECGGDCCFSGGRPLLLASNEASL